MEHHAGFEFAGVIARLIEVRRGIHDLIPIDGAEEHLSMRLELANHLAKVIAAVTIQHHEFRNLLTVEGIHEVGQQGGLGARIHIETERNVELDKNNTELEKINQRQKGLVSVVSHEFRSALTSIRGFSELISGTECSPEEIKEFATIILSDTERITRLIVG